MRRPSASSASAWVRLAALTAFVAVAGAVVARLGIIDSGATWTRGDAAGPGTTALFALAYALATLAPVPKNLLTVTGGAVFGFWGGAVVVWVAAMAGASAAFLLGRLLGREAVERLARGRLRRVEALLDRYGGYAVLGLRLVPVVPFTAVNYGSGLAPLRFRAYVLASGIGIVPGTLAYVALGAYGTDPTSVPFLLAAGVLVVLSAVGVVAAVRRRRSRGPTTEGEPD